MSQISERIEANTIVFADMLRAFQQELLATFDTVRNGDNARVLERMEQLDGAVTALAGTVGELLVEVRGLRGDVEAMREGLKHEAEHG